MNEPAAGASSSRSGNAAPGFQDQILEAERRYRQELQADSSNAGTWLGLGNCLMQQQRWTEALDAYCGAIRIRPDEAQAHSNFAVALLRLGRSDEAETHARRAVELNKSSAFLWANLGACLFEKRRWLDALQAFRQAQARDPLNAEILANVGVAEHRGGRLAHAQRSFEQSLAIAPDNLNTELSYASLLSERGQPQAALSRLQAILSRHPQLPQAWLAAGAALQRLGDLPQATAAMRRAYALAPSQCEVCYGLAHVLSVQYLIDEAEAICRQVLAGHPKLAEAHWLLGTILGKQGRQVEAVGAFRRSVDLQPNAERHSRLLLQLQYSEGSTLHTLRAAHREWDDQYCKTIVQSPSVRVRGRDDDRRLRIGFVSTDFRVQPVGFLALGALERLDKACCSSVCYCDRVGDDVLTTKFRGASDVWRTTTGLSDDEFAELVRADGIDILVDLMGHTGSRLTMFARRLAPVQLSWLGYVGTTGMESMDYLLADRFHVRDDEMQAYTETVLRMPHGYACYYPSPLAPDVGPLPAIAAGHITFGCLNNPAKYSSRILDAWAEILRLVSSAKLLLKYGGLDQAGLQRRIREQFADRGIDPARVVCEGASPHQELLAAYNRVDIALDTQPYSGGLTTCEALWMGVPVITCPGPTFAGRHSTSHLANAGFDRFVAPDLAGYVALAVQWAGRLRELAEIRPQTRDQVSKTPLCDAPRFANDFLAVLMSAWRSSSSDNSN